MMILCLPAAGPGQVPPDNFNSFRNGLDQANLEETIKRDKGEADAPFYLQPTLDGLSGLYSGFLHNHDPKVMFPKCVRAGGGGRSRRCGPVM